MFSTMIVQQESLNADRVWNRARWHISRSGHSGAAVTFRSHLAFNSFGTDITISLIQTFVWKSPKYSDIQCWWVWISPWVGSPVSHKWMRWPENLLHPFSGHRPMAIQSVYRPRFRFTTFSGKSAVSRCELHGERAEGVTGKLWAEGDFLLGGQGQEEHEGNISGK